MAHSGYVIADNDSSDTGMTAARATELPYWMPDTTGTDINDFHKLYGTFKTSQELRRWLSQIRDERDYYTG
jgi:putative DNA primase/helicase